MDAVAHTAFAVAAVRAAESRRPDRLFDDPFAAAFLRSNDITLSSPDVDSPDRNRRGLARGIVIRTRFFDELLTEAAIRCRQVVILGAGLDTRAYRLSWPEGTQFYELDRPAVLDWKQRVLDEMAASPNCDRRLVAGDLRDDWTAALASAGHRSELPTVWLAEGLLAYLDADAVDELLRAATRVSANDSRMGLTIRTGPTAPAMTDLWISHAPEDPVSWLDDHGWQATVHRRGDLATTYGRPEWSALSSRSLIEAVRAPR